MRESRFGQSLLFRMSTVLSVCALLVVALLFLCSFCEYRSYRMELFENNRNTKESFLVEEIKLINRGLMMADDVVDESIKNALVHCSGMYSSGWDVSCDLAPLKKGVSYLLHRQEEDVRLNVIDREGVILFSSDPGSLGMDFKRWPPFYKQLLSIFNRLGPVVDPWSRDLNHPGKIHKYGYIPTEDGRYLISIGVSDKGIHRLKDEYFSFDGVLARAREKVDDFVLGVTINRNGRISGMDETSLRSTLADAGVDPEDVRDQALMVFEDRKTISRSFTDDLNGRWLYLDFEDDTSASGDNLNLVLFTLFSSKVANGDIRSKLTEMAVIFLALTLVLAIVLFLVHRYLSVQVKAILEDIDRIASGDLDHRIKSVSLVELRKLEKSINRMVRRIKRQIERDRIASETISRELSLRKQAEEQLKLANQALFKQATIDDLTGLFNRRSLMSTLEREIARCHEEGASLGLMVIDLDKFKEINDLLGHLFGDRILTNAAGFLLETCSDFVVGRYGGDEFMCILPGLACDTLVEKGKALLRGVSDVGIDGIKLSFSIGGTTFQDGDTAESILQRADSLMYRAKKNRNTFCFDVEGNGLCVIP
ncbi:MAG: diguanylate cyclase [Dethiosulfovibrio sp.]|nr:diguanylate cyclase [Dethiosulfovibrio sp.]